VNRHPECCHAGSLRRSRRRGLLALLVGALAAYPALGQQQNRIPRIVYLTGRNAPPDPSADAVRQGLRELGYVEGRTIQFEAHYFGDRLDSAPAEVGALVQKATIVVSPTFILIQAAMRASRTVPIVIVSNQDPVAAGFVASLSRPGGNVTGVSRLLRELSGKRLELLKEVIPGLARVGIVWNQDSPSANWADYQPAAGTLKLHTESLPVRGPVPDLEGVFQSAVKARSGAVILTRNFLLVGHSRRAAELAIRHRLPLMCEGTEEVIAGALMSYSGNDAASYRRAAFFVDRILKGAKPGELPIDQSSEFELVVNLKTARAIGLPISKDFLLRAHKVIE